MRFKTAFLYFICSTGIFLFSSWIFTESSPNVVAGLTIRVQTNDIPVLKESKNNPLLIISLNVTGEDKLTITGLRYSLNSDVISSISSLDVFLTGAEPFHDAQKIAKTAIISSNGLIEFQLPLSSGNHRLWLSPVLKSNIPYSGLIHLSCSSFSIEGRGEVIPQQISTRPRPIGIVLCKAGDQQIHTFRIPGLIQTKSGNLISVFDARYEHSRDLPANIDVGMKRSTDSGLTWEPLKIIMDMAEPHDNNGIGDPTILYDPVTSTLWVAALWSKGNRSIAGSIGGHSPDSTGQLMLVSSRDEGLTWTKPVSITHAVKNPSWTIFFNGPGNGIVMEDGTLVFPAQYWDENRIPHSTIIYSQDHGQSWIGRIEGPKSNTTESQVVETTPGTLMLNMRDNRGRYRSVATTSNLGRNWIEHPTSYSVLPDPVCMGSLIKGKISRWEGTQDVLFFSNPATQSGRFNITIKASLDYGESWPADYHYLLDNRNSYGYSSLTMADPSHLAILYEGEGDLFFVRIPVSVILP